MTDSSSFFLLDERIQRFIWSQGWDELRDAQERAIPLIVNADRDVIIAAATASGKTEAAFLPALTHILKEDATRTLIIYISPLKALINDQFGRLDILCGELEVPVWPWHGDISASVKSRFLKSPSGVLLITPESLEALFCNRGSSVTALFGGAAMFVVDELHAFIGSERGKQMQSLLHRAEMACNRAIPRIGLSATLGDMSLAAEFLRPSRGAAVSIIDSGRSNGELKILLKGFEEPLVLKTTPAASGPQEDDEASDEQSPTRIAAHLFRTLRGSNNLVFPNSRREVERYTHLLNKLCAEAGVLNEFWPHHGSLSKEIRFETEFALKQKERPATAICTNTLELGIDIGAVKSVVQIGAPPSVASLRQRLGRSGRRKGESAILRGYALETEVGINASLATQLRLGTIEQIAMISLLLDGWFEPPTPNGAHFSTLIQQLLSLIAQRGGVTAHEAFSQLCGKLGPFGTISTSQFKELLTHLGEIEILTQDSSGLLLHGRVSEKFVNHYTFYAAFSTDEEFRLIAGGRPLGTLPISQMLTIGQRILFGGRTWRVEEIQEKEKTIYVVRARGGTPPQFSGGSGRTHTKVRQRMRDLLSGHGSPAYLDETASRFLNEGRDAYKRLDLDRRTILEQGPYCTLVTWLGDSSNDALGCLLSRFGLTAVAAGPGLEIAASIDTVDRVERAIADIAADEPPTINELLQNAKNLEREKWDWALPRSLLEVSFASLNLDLIEARQWCTAAAASGVLATPRNN